MMSARQKGLAVLAIQLLLVLSIGVKYAWERHHCPMVWAQASRNDPEEPVRGRYIGLQLHANACGLPASNVPPGQDQMHIPAWQGIKVWRVVPAVRDGQLAPIAVDETRAGPTQEVYLGSDVPCDDAMLSALSYFFIPEHAKSQIPTDRNSYRALWALVTVPPSGPPRPVKLAITDSTGFHVLDLD